MARKIKFRAWSREKMEYFELFEKPWPFEDGCPVMQFTGLKDKNGKEIYEGDIVGGYPHGTIEVVWNSEFACFEAGNYADMEDENGEMQKRWVGSLLANDLKDCFDKWEIIGNIYENKDLLK